MKLPFSYRKTFFKQVFFTSALGHLIFFTASDSFFSTPQFAVKKAPSSMEVIILETPRIQEVEKQPQLVLSSKAASSEEVQMPRKKRHIVPEKNNTRSAYVPPIKGAETEMKPDYLKNPAPLYPEFARERGWEGLVILKVFVEKNGYPSIVRVDQSSQYKILDDAALKAVRKWQFKPAHAGHLSFSSWIRIPIRFRLIDETL